MSDTTDKTIKIFVSHTAGSNNQTIDNPLFVNVRGGAVFDKRDNVDMPGDDTGDNISKLNRHFSEYSVIYWAWKNQDCDYYGLCHYRRFLSFTEKRLSTSGLRQVNFDGLTPATEREAGLDSEEQIRRFIGDADMVVPMEHDVVKHDCKDNRIKNVRQFWLRYHASYLKDREFDLILELIRKHNPEYYQDALDYMNQLNFRGFNCFVMKKALFNEFCEYAFPMLFEFEDRCDRTHNSPLTNRNTGYAGEWFFSIFVYHKMKESSCKIKETQLIVFGDTAKTEPLKPAFSNNNIPIAFAVSDINAHKVAATMQSIIENCKIGNNLDFILLYSGNNVDKWRNHLLAQELSALVSMGNGHENVSVRAYNPKNEIGRLELRKHVNVKHKERYYALMLPFILKEYDRAIYISDTMLCKKDLGELMGHSGGAVLATYDLNYVAMVNGYIQGYGEKMASRLGIQDPYACFSSDIIAYDLEEARREYSLDKVVDKLLEKTNYDSQLTTTEAFNLVYEGGIKPVSQGYNAFLPLEPDYYAITEYIPEEYDKGAEDPILVNLRGMHQVIRDSKLLVVKEYLSCAKRTPFYEEHLLDMSYSSIFKKEKKIVKRVYFSQLNNEYIAAHKTGEQAFADKLFPMGSPLRNAIDTALPKGSKRQEMVKKVIKDIRNK
ncbi:DUF4422 domain-containing protein [Butyrivibrio sp. AE2032]|uniref:DUF4422 domain-containing protein n=1 Tax=Butyrivibrio sp. AE2032 TaxID=1458463 RepID=UPI0005549656|nr:DUF4422 domain-containing protein [Butyrivibrio sp. AE2032]